MAITPTNGAVAPEGPGWSLYLNVESARVGSCFMTTNSVPNTHGGEFRREFFTVA